MILDHADSSSGAGALWQDHGQQGKKWQDHHQWLDHADSSSGAGAQCHGQQGREWQGHHQCEEARVCTDKGPTTLNSS